MAKIPGIVFLIVGLVLSLVSLYVNRIQKTSSLTIFVYLGYLFIAYGSAKILIRYVMKGEKDDKKWKEWSEGENPNDRTPDSDYFTPPALHSELPTLAIEPNSIGLQVKASHGLAIQIESKQPLKMRIWHLMTNWFTYLTKGIRRW